MTQTRSLAAIMAIDVAGYSRLMGEDRLWQQQKLVTLVSRVVRQA